MQVVGKIYEVAPSTSTRRARDREGAGEQGGKGERERPVSSPQARASTNGFLELGKCSRHDRAHSASQESEKSGGDGSSSSCASTGLPHS